MVKIYVGNLSKNAHRDDLFQLFSKFGRVTECDVLREFGFVHMDNMQSAQEAVKSLNGTPLCGTSIRVELSTGGNKRDLRGPPPRDDFRSRDRSPLRNRDRGPDSYYRDRDTYDQYSSGPQPPPFGGDSSFYGPLASAAANVHHQLVRDRVQDPGEIYHRMYLALSSIGQGNQAPSYQAPSGGYGDRDSGYSGSRYANYQYDDRDYDYDRGHRF